MSQYTRSPDLQGGQQVLALQCHLQALKYINTYVTSYGGIYS
jgi:hypothetical protein